MSEPSEKRPAKSIERVTISDEVKLKLQALCDQANLALQGMATISKSDVVNLILEEHGGTLSKSAIDRLRSVHFDEVRFAQWMANRLKSARQSGETVSLLDLIERGKSLVSTPRERAPRRMKRRSRSGAEETASQKIDVQEESES